MRFATLSDLKLIEEICSLPEIRQWTAFDGAPPPRILRFLSHLSRVIIDEQAGCFLFGAVDYNKFVVHTNLLPTCRGKDALRFAKAARMKMFTETSCNELLTMVPTNNRQAKWFTLAMGFKHRFTRKDIWLKDGVKYDMEYFGLTIDEWILSGACTEYGVMFHDEIERLGSHVEHAQDATHDAYVGATWLMMLSGQIEKAQSIYNRWAHFTGYERLKVLSNNPLTVDIRNCVLQMDNAQLRIVENEHA